MLMKKWIGVLVLAALTMCISAASNSIVGDWEGTLSVQGTKLRIVFHVMQNENGSYRSTMDSPDQGALGLAVAKTTFDADTLTMDVAVAQGVYTGIYDNEKNCISGTWTQGPYHLPLDLKPAIVIESTKE